MSEQTKIEWCDHSWSPWLGCTKVSPGCANCYAAARDKRHLLEAADHWGPGKPRWRTRDWKKPLRWNKDHGDLERSTVGLPIKVERRRVFPSLCDWLDDEVPIEWLSDFMTLVFATPNLDWLLLTKRPELFAPRMRQVLDSEAAMMWLDEGSPPRNLWIGTSVEDQQRANERIPALLRIPARVRWLSVEPLLGPVDLTRVEFVQTKVVENVLVTDPGPRARQILGQDFRINGIDWVVVGGESGPLARPCNVEWIRSMVESCQGANVPVFVKQDSGPKPGKQGRIPDDVWTHKEFPC